MVEESSLPPNLSLLSSSSSLSSLTLFLLNSSSSPYLSLSLLSLSPLSLIKQTSQGVKGFVCWKGVYVFMSCNVSKALEPSKTVIVFTPLALNLLTKRAQPTKPIASLGIIGIERLKTT